MAQIVFAKERSRTRKQKSPNLESLFNKSASLMMTNPKSPVQVTDTAILTTSNSQSESRATHLEHVKRTTMKTLRSSRKSRAMTSRASISRTSQTIRQLCREVWLQFRTLSLDPLSRWLILGSKTTPCRPSSTSRWISLSPIPRWTSQMCLTKWSLMLVQIGETLFLTMTFKAGLVLTRWMGLWSLMASCQSATLDVVSTRRVSKRKFRSITN